VPEAVEEGVKLLQSCLALSRPKGYNIQDAGQLNMIKGKKNSRSEDRPTGKYRRKEPVAGEI
jgi:hypothetical protein